MGNFRFEMVFYTQFVSQEQCCETELAPTEQTSLRLKLLNNRQLVLAKRFDVSHFLCTDS